MRSAVMMAKPIEVEKLQTWMGTTYRVALAFAGFLQCLGGAMSAGGVRLFAMRQSSIDF